MANLDDILRGEALQIAKIGDDFGERAAQGLFKYQIRFSVALIVTQICTVKETSLFSDFWLIFRIIGPLGMTQIF